jgi:hypothetical protein
MNKVRTRLCTIDITLQIPKTFLLLLPIYSQFICFCLLPLVEYMNTVNMGFQQRFSRDCLSYPTLPGSGGLRASLNAEEFTTFLQTPVLHRNNVHLETSAMSGGTYQFCGGIEFLHPSQPTKKQRLLSLFRRVLHCITCHHVESGSLIGQPLLQGDPTKLPGGKGDKRFNSNSPPPHNPLVINETSPKAPLTYQESVSFSHKLRSRCGSHATMQREYRKLLQARKELRELEARADSVIKEQIRLRLELNKTIALNKHYKWLYERDRAKVEAQRENFTAKENRIIILQNESRAKPSTAERVTLPNIHNEIVASTMTINEEMQPSDSIKPPSALSFDEDSTLAPIAPEQYYQNAVAHHIKKVAGADFISALEPSTQSRQPFQDDSISIPRPNKPTLAFRSAFQIQASPVKKSMQELEDTSTKTNTQIEISTNILDHYSCLEHFEQRNNLPDVSASSERRQSEDEIQALENFLSPDREILSFEHGVEDCRDASLLLYTTRKYLK